MRVVVPPVLVGDRICRIVSALESLLEVEEWVGAWWEPSSIPLTLASRASRASDAMLDARGVPESDRAEPAVWPTQGDIEALMRARDPQRPDGMRFDEETVVRAQPVRKPDYPGNARFRKNTPLSGVPIATSPRTRSKKPSDRKDSESP
jgi:hypothetical protein